MKKSIFAYIALVVLLGVMSLFAFNINVPQGAASQYFCDYHNISFDMDVNVQDMDGNSLYTINGEFFAAYEDDLAMTTKDGQLVKHTNDIYNFITQNEHVIYDSDNNVCYSCDGKIKLFADSYDVFDADNKKVAYVSFNMFDTAGIMKDMDGNMIARYDSALWRKDYVVSIYDNCPIDDDVVLLIFASYVSDVRSDSSN